MDSIDIFLTARSSWLQRLECISKFLGVPGTDDSDSLGLRHVWHVCGLDIIAINNPDLDDDLGIPFASYNMQVNLSLSNQSDLTTTDQLRLALAKAMTLKLQRQMGKNATVIRNLQKEISVGQGSAGIPKCSQ